MKRLLVGLALFSLAVFLLDGARTVFADASRADAQEVTLTGVITVLWGDRADGGQTPALYRLHQADGQVVQLIPGPAEADLLAARGQTVQVSGQWSAARPAGANLLTGSTAFFDVQHIASLLGRSMEADNRLTGSFPWVTLMCRFNDNPSTPRDLAFFQGMYANLPGRLDHYWREMSYQQVNVEGSQALGWYVLPKPRAAYNVNGDATRFNLEQAASDCTAAADAAVDFSSFVGINLMFNDNLDGYAWGGQHWFGTSLDGKNYFYVTWEPPWGYADITVLKHEMGHGFGLPHSAYNDSVTYDNAWDVMSDAWEGCYTAPAFKDPVYGCMGQGTIAAQRDRLGWIPDNQKAQVDPGHVATLALDWLGAPSAANNRMIRIPIQDTGRFYTVEARGYTYTPGLDPWPGYDQKFQPFLGSTGGQGVVIHLIDPSRPNEAHVIDVDNNGNTADAGSYFLPGEVYNNSADQVTVRVLSKNASGFVVQVGNAVAIDPPTEVTISGPTVGYSGTNYTFNAAVLPQDVTAPITYTWSASGQASKMYRGGSSDSVSFSWAITGTQTISVQAANSLGSATQTYQIQVFQPGTLLTACPAGKKCVFMPLALR